MVAAAVVAKFPQLVFLLAILCLREGLSFSLLTHSHSQRIQKHCRQPSTSSIYSCSRVDADDIDDNDYHHHYDSDTDIQGRPNKSPNTTIIVGRQQQRHQYRRRNVLSAVAATTLASAAYAVTTSSFPFILPNAANAAVGTLPEFSDTNAVLQSITIDVIDKSQFDETIAFFTGGAFEGMKLLRKRNNVPVAIAGENDNNNSPTVQEAWLGFGPETLSIPSSFTLPVSSFSQYGGHASIHVRYDPQLRAPEASSSKKTTPPAAAYYQRSSGEYNNAPPTGDNIAYLQLGVPAYRISQMVKNYGNILDAYGWVNVISPCGLPVRAIVGIRPDPIMFVAVNCLDAKKSEEFYYETLGFVRQEYPYARLNKGQGQFEPPQPPKSVYIGPSPNCMGILLLQNKNRKKPIAPNPTLHSLNVVYAPVDDGSTSNSSGSDDSAGIVTPRLLDPSYVPISFISQASLEKEIQTTSIATSS